MGRRPHFPSIDDRVGHGGLGFSYDAAGALGSVVYPSYSGETNPTATYAYNDIGQMESVTDWSGNKVRLCKRLRRERDPAGRRSEHGQSERTVEHDDVL